MRVHLVNTGKPEPKKRGRKPKNPRPSDQPQPQQQQPITAKLQTHPITNTKASSSSYSTSNATDKKSNQSLAALGASIGLTQDDPYPLDCPTEHHFILCLDDQLADLLNHQVFKPDTHKPTDNTNESNTMDTTTNDDSIDIHTLTNSNNNNNNNPILLENTSAMDQLSITFLDPRHATIAYPPAGITRTAILVDLPCILESQKSIDTKQLHKVADASQMLLVLDGPGVSAQQLKQRIHLIEQVYQYSWPHGLSPQFRDISEQRHRRRHPGSSALPLPQSLVKAGTTGTTEGMLESRDLDMAVQELLFQDGLACEVDYYLVDKDGRHGHSFGSIEELCQAQLSGSEVELESEEEDGPIGGMDDVPMPTSRTSHAKPYAKMTKTAIRKQSVMEQNIASQSLQYQDDVDLQEQMQEEQEEADDDEEEEDDEYDVSELAAELEYNLLDNTVNTMEQEQEQEEHSMLDEQLMQDEHLSQQGMMEQKQREIEELQQRLQERRQALAATANPVMKQRITQAIQSIEQELERKLNGA